MRFGDVMRAVGVAVVTIAVLAGCGSSGGLAPGSYRAGDYAKGGFNDILPPGENGHVGPFDFGAYELTGARPSHSFDQFDMYGALLFGSAGLRAKDLSKYFKDSSFGVPAGQISRLERPRADVVIARDNSFGVPHVYGSTRGGTEFGAGYADAEDRLFLMDALRHAGRGQLAMFAGGSEGNRAMDRAIFAGAPYSERDLQQQVARLPVLYGADGRQLATDMTNYVNGINLYIDKSRQDRLKVPAEYYALGHLGGAAHWKLTDLVATATLIGENLGQGGGNQLRWALILEGFRRRFGARLGTTLWKDWRERNDPEAPTTVTTGARFPYELAPPKPAPDGIALPDQGSVRFAKLVTATSSAPAAATPPPPVPPPAVGPAATGGAAVARGQQLPHSAAPLSALVAFPHSDSNALLVAARHSTSGHPLAVFGPQVGYLNPQLFTEKDMHGPGIAARGASIAGLGLYVEQGHGGDYAWSATSAGQDIIHTFAVELCNADGSPASTGSVSYMFRGRCRAMRPVRQLDAWTRSLGDPTPSGSQTLTVYRTVLGPVTARATIHGRPVAYTQLRSTYGHEFDSSLGFSDFNNPNRIHNARDFQRAAYRIGYTFNWLYADDRDIAYFNSGSNPVADPRVDPILPVAAKYPWQHFDATVNTASYTAFAQHPQVVDQDSITSWNNKQALAFSGSNSEYGSIYRSQLLDERIAPLIAGGRKTTLPALVSAMEDAATVDLRAERDLGWALGIVGHPSDPQLAAAVAKLRAWRAAGSHRIDPTQRGRYAHSQAIAILDAWYPLLVRGEFQPTLGKYLFAQLAGQLSIDDPPNHGSGNPHVGSAYDTGWFGYVDKDLRRILHQPERGRFHHVYCGAGNRAACRAMLEDTLRQAVALARDQPTLYQDRLCASPRPASTQECFDEIFFSPIGITTVPPLAWVNRPTYQQAVDIAGHRRR
jgi:acyl-homoserine lactone acylase PvdQ